MWGNFNLIYHPGAQAQPKKKKQPRGAAYKAIGELLEPNLRPSHELEVVVSAVVEINLVAGLQANAQPSGIELDTAARIENTVGIAIF